jgi:hypothetical protein
MPGRGTADTVRGTGHSDRISRAHHRVYCSVAGGLAAAFATTLLLWPDLGRVLPGGPLPPLHTRCLASLHLALAGGLLSARRRIDPPAARIPLLIAALWGGLALLNTLARGVPGSGRAWLLVLGTAALGAGWLHGRSADGAPTAERPVPGWTVVGGLAGGIALALLLQPAWAAAQWPWRMPVVQAPAYGAPLLAFAVGALAAGRERRAYAREPVRLAWLVLVAGLLVASGFHHTLFDPARFSSWLWFGLLAAAAVWLLWPHHGRGWTRPDRRAAHP